MSTPTQETQVDGTVLNVRKHGKRLCFLTVQVDDDDSVKVGNNSEIQAILCTQEMGSDRLYKESLRYMKPSTKHVFTGYYREDREAKSGTMSLFVTRFQTIKFTPGISPSVVWKLLEDVSNGVVKMDVAASLVGLQTHDLQQALSPATSKQKRKAFCSKTARFIATGKEYRGRHRKPKLTSNEVSGLKKMESTCSILKETILDYKWLQSHGDTSALGAADPLVRILKGGQDIFGDKRRQYAEEKKRPQVQTMIKLVKEVIQNNQVIIDVGGGRGDLGLALAKTFPDHQVLVYEPNRPSLNQGKTRATELGFSNISQKSTVLS